MNKKKTNQKRGWTLVELCVALIALAILVGLSVQSIKPRKIMIAPFAYAGMYNLKQATNAIMNKCVTQGGESIYGCQQKVSRLPMTDENVMAEVNAAIEYYNENLLPEGHTPDAIVTADTFDEIFCMEVGSMFTLANNDIINCKYHGGAGDETKPPTGDGKGTNAGKANFQASNMVSYYYLEMPWLPIHKAAPSEGEDEMWNTVTDSYFKPIIIDVNGPKEPNRLGEDQFPLRLYIDGTITPGSCQLYAGEDAGGNYPKNLYCPSRSVSVGGTETPVEISDSWFETNYPFSYNLLRSYVPEGAGSEDRKTETLLRGVSYQEAACRGGRASGIVVPRGALCNEDGSSYESNISNRNSKVLEKCTSSDHDSFCIGRLARPSNPGLFRLPLM